MGGISLLARGCDMRYQPDDVSHVPVINNTKLSHEDFPVNGQNYDDRTIYTCGRGHEGAEPRVLPYVSSYILNTAKVSITGIIVFVCPTCQQPAHKLDEQKTTYFAVER